MSVSAMAWVWANGPTNGTERLVLLAIADHANDDGFAFPSMSRIAAKACVTERGARGVIRRLEDNGWLETERGGGRGGASVYHLIMEANPERETGNDVPVKENPERETRNTAAKTRNESAETRNRGSAEPSITIKEPSGKNNARDVRCELERFASPDAVASFIAYRRRQKKALTLTAAKRQATQLRAIFDGGGDPDDALGLAEERGWQSVQADWYFNARRNDGKSSHHSNTEDPALRAIAAAAGAFKA